MPCLFIFLLSSEGDIYLLCFLSIKTPVPLKLQDIVCWEALAGANLDLVLELFIIIRT